MVVGSSPTGPTNSPSDLLKLVEADAAPAVELKHSRMILQVRPGTNNGKKQAILAGWYREQIKQAAPPRIAKWERLLRVRVSRVYVQHMKTKWGGCNPAARSVRFNTELARKPRECLEYIAVHEMAHLLEPAHNARFIALIDRIMPNWQLRRGQLNQLPVPHDEWTY